MKALKEYLQELPGGLVADPAVVERLLAEAWFAFHGAQQGGMKPSKILGRTESMAWEPPYLTFTIERHGGTQMGSTRAELQDWSLNLSEGTAEMTSKRHRQLRSMGERMDVKKLAREMAEAILGDKKAEGLKRMPDGRVRVLISTVIPPDGFKQTISGRRKRFRKALEELIAPHGWREAGVNAYRKSGGPEGAKAG